jgi:stearoyl-CoA 9-desaturase NADPH oxidoreductase
VLQQPSRETPRRPGWARLADAFAWPLRTSHYLNLVAPLWSTHTLQARVEGLEDETREARTLTLRPGRGWRGHRPGQFVRVVVSIAGRQHGRTYSISSSPERFEDDGCIAITVKAVAGGRVSPHLVRDVRRGDHLGLGPAQGDFVLPEARPVRPLFVTAGSGITPVMSMLRSLEARGELPDIVHLHYAPDPAEVLFGSELAELAKHHARYRLHLVYTRAARGRRRFTSTELEERCADWGEREAYACGPQTLLDAVESHWRQAGRAERLHVERFGAALAAAPLDSAGGRVRFSGSGLDALADGSTTLLRVAEGAGLCPPHGCRMGICHTCTTTLRAGRVRDLRNNLLIDEPGSKVQICVCAAAGDVELEL